MTGKQPEKQEAKVEGTQDELEALIRAGASPEEEGEDGPSANRGDTVAEETEEEENGSAEQESSEEAKEEKAEEGEGEEAKAEPVRDKDKKVAAKDEEGSKREKWIPRARFDAVNERLKAERARRQELEAQAQAQTQTKQQAAPAFDFEAKEKAYMEAVLDGNTEQALAIRKEIRAAEQAEYESRVKQAVSEAPKHTKEALALDGAVAEMESTYAEFNPEHEDFNQELTDEALALFRGFVGQGYDRAAALRKAATYVAVANGLEKVGASAEKDEEKKPEKAAEPTAKQRKEKLALAGKQPAKAAGTSREHAVHDLEAMTDDEFDALPEATKRRLRGDYV